MPRRPKRIPKQQKPDGIRLEYYKALAPILRDAKVQIDKHLSPVLADLLAESAEHKDADPKKRAKDEAARLIAQAQAKIAKTYDASELESIAQKFGERTDEFQKTQLDRQVRSALGVGLDKIAKSERGIPAKVDGWIAENVDLIVTLPDTYFDDIRMNVYAAIESGTRHETLAKTLAARYDIADRRAQLIARDQIGKLYGDLNKGRQENLGVTEYTWRDSGDNRVRPDHEDRNGDVFSWDDPPEDGHPGEPIDCRCYAEPIFDVLAE